LTRKTLTAIEVAWAVLTRARACPPIRRPIIAGAPVRWLCLGMHRHELSDAEWARIEPLLPAEAGRRGRPADLPTRTFMNAIFYVAKTGAPWRDLPERFGPWHTIIPDDR
jgi:hypothetical protein